MNPYKFDDYELDMRLSIRARGLMRLALAFQAIHGKAPSAAALLAWCKEYSNWVGEGRDAIQTGFSELETHGYKSKRRTKNLAGKWDEGVVLDPNPPRGATRVGFPGPSKPAKVTVPSSGKSGTGNPSKRGFARDGFSGHKDLTAVGALNSFKSSSVSTTTTTSQTAELIDQDQVQRPGEEKKLASLGVDWPPNATEASHAELGKVLRAAPSAARQQIVDELAWQWAAVQKPSAWLFSVVNKAKAGHFHPTCEPGWWRGDGASTANIQPFPVKRTNKALWAEPITKSTHPSDTGDWRCIKFPGGMYLLSEDAVLLDADLSTVAALVQPYFDHARIANMDVPPERVRLMDEDRRAGSFVKPSTPLRDEELPEFPADNLIKPIEDFG